VDTDTALRYLSKIMQTGRFDYVDESVCQAQIEKHLTTLGVTFVKEHRLAEGGIVDFFFPKSGIAMEVKASKQWSKMRVYRQCERYCENEDVKGILLATARSQTLPTHIKGKPAAVFNLGITLL
jgi:hypothetical protein